MQAALVNGSLDGFINVITLATLSNLKARKFNNAKGRSLAVRSVSVEEQGRLVSHTVVEVILIRNKLVFLCIYTSLCLRIYV